MNDHLLDIQHVTKTFSSGSFNRQRLFAVDDVSLSLPMDSPQTLAIAGESGSGKTTLAQMVLGFMTPDSGKVLFRGENIHKMDESDFLQYRRQTQAVFQNPFDAFNPFYHVDHVFETLIQRFQLAKTKDEIGRITEEALVAVRLDPKDTLGRYPHQLSGGQLQRIMIARALILKPKLIVADEPVSMIDVSLRAVILDVLISLKEQFGISLFYITHDLSTALQISDTIQVMYQGSVVECGSAEAVIRDPKHPYTQLLVKSIPLPDPNLKWDAPLTLASKVDVVPAVQIGCKFANRCPFRMDICTRTKPSLIRISPDRETACYLYSKKN